MQVVDATLDHVAQLLAKPIRPDDVDEWFAASGGKDVGLTLREAFASSAMAGQRALLNANGECICLWGLFSEGGLGYIWLIATVEAEAVARSIHRLWRKELRLLHQHHAVLHAVAYALNDLHLHWLKTIGFRLVGTSAVGPGRLPFNTYVRED
nr:hypothetical protein [uncultured Gellertiella sp.]